MFKICQSFLVQQSTQLGGLVIVCEREGVCVCVCVRESCHFDLLKLMHLNLEFET